MAASPLDRFAQAFCTMEPKLFVGNLPMAITEDQLQQVFGAYGSIDRVVLIDKASPSGSRSGFVIYTDHSFAQIAIAALHGNYAFPGSADNVVVRYADSAKGDRRASVPSMPCLWGQHRFDMPMS